VWILEAKSGYTGALLRCCREKNHTSKAPLELKTDSTMVDNEKKLLKVC